MIDINFYEFHTILLEETRSTFKWLQEKYAGETIYGYWLYREPLWGLVHTNAVYGGNAHTLRSKQQGYCPK
jgi:hypothetical protein